MNTALHIPKNGLNIDRAVLPQIKSTDVQDFIHWLKTIKHTNSVNKELPVASLIPSQGNFNTHKIHELMGEKQENLKKPVIISADHYVVDGHHRWLALLNMNHNEMIPVIQVNLKINDLLAVMNEYPKSFKKTVVESFSSFLFEDDKHKVIAFGRMNPPTSGHEKLVNKVKEVAKKNDAEHSVILSHSQDEKKNPLSQNTKIKHAKRFFPNTHIEGSDKEAPTIFHHAAKAYKQGVDHLHIVAGQDRVKEFKDSLNKHNGKFDDKGNGYNFKSITVHSAGSRDPDAEGVEGMSASRMREHASKKNFSEFKKGVPSHISEKQAKELYHDVRKSMGNLDEAKDPTKNLKLLKLYSKAFKRVSNSPAQLKISKEIDAQRKKLNLDESFQMLTEGVHDAGIFKAVFLAGGPGSGKDFVLKKALDGHGLTEVNSDTAFTHLLDKNKLDKKMPDNEHKRRMDIRDKAKNVTELKQRLAIEGRNGLIINSTGATVNKIKDLKKKLEDLGYDTTMVFVDTTDEVSQKRNTERGMRGGRQVPEKIRSDKYKEAQDAKVEFSKMFGTDNYKEFDNNEDLRKNLDTEVHKQKAKELLDLFKHIKKFTQAEPKAPQAQEWIQEKLGQLAYRNPIGNKKQQDSKLQPHESSEAAQEAKAMGLQYYGYGRYGKEGKVTHLSLHDKLIEKKKKSLNEEFQQILSEGEPVADSDVEGAILGGGSLETIDLPSGKATSVPKKSFLDFRKGKTS